MKYVDEYRNLKLASKLSKKIRGLVKDDSRSYNFMEVCGTHTNTFFRFGLMSLLPKNLHLISGPGCPVCVTDTSYIDNSISLARLKDVIWLLYKVMGTVSAEPTMQGTVYHFPSNQHYQNVCNECFPEIDRLLNQTTKP